MSNTTRRAALTALASVPALALPGVTVGRPDHPDAEIFALIDRCREDDKLLNAASDAHEEMLWTQAGPSLSISVEN